MYDPENQLYTAAYDALTTEFSPTTIDITSEYVREPAILPHVSIVMTDCYTMRRGQNSSNTEVLTAFTMEVSAYSNKKQGKKSECKKMIKTVDDVFFGFNLQRISQTPVPNLEDATIYRIVARYTGLTDGKYFYRR